MAHKQKLEKQLSDELPPNITKWNADYEKMIEGAESPEDNALRAESSINRIALPSSIIARGFNNTTAQVMMFCGLRYVD